MFLSRLSKRERYIVYITVVVVISILFDKVVLSPIIERINKLNREIFIQEKRLEKSLRILAQEELITSEYKKYTQFIRQSRSDEEEIAEFLSDIEKLVRKSSVFLADIKPGSVITAGPYRKYTVEIKTESKISYLADFIYQLEESPRLFRVKDFRLMPKKKDSTTLKMRMTVTQILIVSEKAK